jgi:Tol biopolymer transport system component
MRSFLPRSWFPDSRHIVATGVDLEGRWGNYRVDVDSGRFTPLVLSDRPSLDTDIGPGEAMADGRIVYFNGARQALVVRDGDTGAENRVVDLEALSIEVRGGRYRFSPDSQTLAFTGFRSDRSSVILAVEPGGAPPREVVESSSPVAVLFQDWMPDSQGLIFTRYEGPDIPTSLWRVSRDGGEPQSLELAMVGLRDVSMHPDGGKVTFTAGWPMKELWVLENFLTGP